MRMVVMVPSRGRPANVARLLDAWAGTGATADVVVLVDDDDPTVPEYVAACEGRARLAVGPRQWIGPLLNDWAPRLAEEFDVVGFVGDDVIPRTPGWDARILEVSTPWTVVYPNDLLQGERLATTAFQGSGLVRALGQFCAQGLDHLFVDNYWKSIGSLLGTLVYLDDVVLEHMHYLAGKAPTDAVYARVNDPGQYARDGAAFRLWADRAAAADVAAVRAAMTRAEEGP